MGHSKYRAYLKEEFQARRTRNRRYSLRSFARDLDVQPSQLSKVLHGKQHLRPATARKIACSLFADARDRELFFQLISLEISGAEAPAISQILSLMQAQKFSGDEASAIRGLNHWYDLALLALVPQSAPSRTPEEYGLLLGVKPEDIHQSLTALQAAGMLNESSHDSRTPRIFSSTDEASKNLHRQFLDNALTSLDLSPSRDRFFGYQSVMLPRDRFDELNRWAREFFAGLPQSTLLSSSKSKDNLYQVSMQIFNLQKKNL